MHDYCFWLKLTSKACLLLLWFTLLKHFIQYALQFYESNCLFFLQILNSLMQCEKKFMHKLSIVWFLVRDKSRVVPVHAMKAERDSRSIASPILNISTRRRWVVDWTPQLQLFYAQERTVIPFKWGAGWAPELVWILWRRERSLTLWL